MAIGALLGIILLWAVILNMVEDYKDRELCREIENCAHLMLFAGVALDTDLGPAVVYAERNLYYYFQDGFTWKPGQVGRKVFGSGYTYSDRKYQKASLDFKKSQRGRIVYQPKLDFTEAE